MSNLLPTTFKYEDDPSILTTRLTENYTEFAEAINARDIAVYSTDQILNGQQFRVAGTIHEVFRKVIVFGALPNAATKSVAHGITINATVPNFYFTRIYGTAKDPTTNIFLTLPHVNVTALASQISLFADSTNVNVVTGINRTNFTECYIILEYWYV